MWWLVFAPDGKLITDVDNPNGSQGVEPVHITAEATGIDRLEVSSFEKGARPGRYQVKLVELRQATQPDREGLAARRAFDEGERLRNQKTRDSWPAAFRKYEEALALYQLIEARREQFTVLLGMGNTNRMMNESPKAVECFDEALRIAQSLGDKFRQGGHSNSLRLCIRIQESGRKAKLLPDPLSV